MLGKQRRQAHEKVSGRLAFVQLAEREKEIEMTSQEAAVYREIQKNADNGMKTIDTMYDMVHDEALAMQLSRQSLKYSEVYHEASKELIEAKAQGYKSTALSDAMLRMGVHYNTMLNTSTSHIAELLIKESTNGIVGMEKALKHNERAGEGPVALAKQLIDLEEKNVARLKQYL